MDYHMQSGPICVVQSRYSISICNFRPFVGMSFYSMVCLCRRWNEYAKEKMRTLCEFLNSVPFFYLVFIFSFVLHNGIFFLWLICDSVVIRLEILRVFLGWYLLFMFRFFFGEKKYKLLLMCVTSVNCKWGCLV